MYERYLLKRKETTKERLNEARNERGSKEKSDR
jgi:hypothetical protein